MDDKQIARWRTTADLDARHGAPVGDALREAADEVERLRAERDALAEQVKHASDLDLIRLAIADPGAFVKRERFNEGDYETVPAWGARAVVVALREGRGGR